MKTFTHFKKSIIQSRRRLILFLAAFAFCGFATYAQNAASVVFNPSSVTLQSGENFTVNVRIEIASGSVDFAQIHFDFDKTKLQVTSITKPGAAIFPNEFFPLQSLSTINTNGRVNYAAGTSSNFPTSSFDVLTVTFSAIQTGSTQLTFRRPPTGSPLTNVIRSGSSIITGVTNASVTIQSCAAPTGTISVGSGASTCNGQPVPVTLAGATGTGPFTLDINGVTYTGATVGSVLANIPFPTYSVWPSNPTPDQLSNNDGQSIEVGMKFRSSQAGFIKGIRFYVPNAAAGTSHTGKLWNPAAPSTPMATATFTPSSGGWQQVMFASPVPIAPNTTYIASCFSSSGYYSETDNYFTSAQSNGPLTALVNNGPDGVNGVYRYGAGMPTLPYDASNYWVDVVFASNTNTINLTRIADASGCELTGALQSINVFSANCSSLPITLLNLSATPGSHKVTLRWTTVQEINNRGFDIQRSVDGANWTTIGYVDGAGNSNSVKNYTYIDNDVEQRKYYYRLKQIDIDERSTYSAIVAATLGAKAEFVLGQSYPNPARSQATVQFTLPKSENVNISLFDMNGKLMKVLVNGSREAGTHAVSFNVSMLAKGIYYYKMQAGDFSDVKKLTIQ